MILTSFAVALIAIVFGAQLLAQSQKENLNALYKYLAWFIIVMGFCVLLCDGVHGLFSMCHRGQGGMMRREMMIDKKMGGPMGCQMMMHCNDGNMNCMGNNNCCGGQMNCCNTNNCSDGMMNCPDGGNSSCKGSMPADCPMMGGGMKSKADSGKDKK
jgi:hypothetical protein